MLPLPSLTVITLCSLYGQLKRRLTGRGDTADNMDLRLETAAKELEQAKEVLLIGAVPVIALNAILYRWHCFCY